MSLTVRDAVVRLAELGDAAVVREVGEAFSAAGFEISLVGGPVRDAILGRPVTDFDFTTNARPEDTLTILKAISTAQWDVGRAFGTIAAQVKGHQVEVTTYRADEYDHETRKPTVSFGDELAGDLLRRDFTVNAMALRLSNGALVDPTNGLTDLIGGILKTPIEPEVSFGDDPLRIMRLARFVSQLGFTPDEDTFAAAKAQAESIKLVSAERVRDELVKLILGDFPERGLAVLVDSGLADLVLPELPALRFEPDEHHPHKDNYEHTMQVIRQAIDQEEDGPDLILRMAAMLHDIGKAKTRKIEPGGKVTFYNHDLVGARMARKRLKALRFDNATIESITRLIELHLRFFGYSDSEWADSAVRRYVRDAGPELKRLHKITRADVTTRNAAKAARLAAAYDDIERRIDELAEQEALDSIRPDLDGAEIMQILGLAPGPEVGKAYRFLLELRLDEGPLAKEEAEKRLRAWAAEGRLG